MNGKRILVVEDEKMMRELLGVLLEDGGFVVELASSGEDGLSKIRERRPDLLLLDLIMPGISGWDVLDRLKDHPDPPAVVVMSGMGAEPNELRAIGHFVCGYLPKPFATLDLTHTCAQALAGRQSPPAPQHLLAEHRGDARRDIVVPATLSSSTGEPLLVGHILNLNATGAMLDLGATLPPGKEIGLAFEIPGARGFFNLTGQVPWVKGGRLGVRFTNVPDEEVARLAQLVSTPRSGERRLPSP
jgi:two-component system, OmpR family, alkaline phosphatase synthesis response regulator PhoP